MKVSNDIFGTVTLTIVGKGKKHDFMSSYVVDKKKMNEVKKLLSK